MNENFEKIVQEAISRCEGVEGQMATWRDVQEKIGHLVAMDELSRLFQIMWNQKFPADPILLEKFTVIDEESGETAALDKLTAPEKQENDEKQSKKGKPQALKIFHLIEEEELEFFKSDMGKAFIRFPVDEHFEIWPCRSKAFTLWIMQVYYEQTGSVPNADAVKSAVSMCEGKALFDGRLIRLSNRVHYCSTAKELYYDLVDDEWQYVKITADGYSIANSDILFQRFAHQNMQMKPIENANPSDVWKLMDFVNITDQGLRLLFLTWVITNFIPEFPHPALVLYGDQGSTKSFTTALIKSIVDPSKILTLEMHSSHEEVVQFLYHHWLAPFDNLSYLTSEISDMLCRAVTGAGFSKRELFSDDDDVIYQFKRCLILNGINVAVSKPDLMERSVLVELEKPQVYKTETDIWEAFEKAKPIILGGIFATLVQTLKYVENVKLSKIPRMADFATWGYAIAETLKTGGGKEFEEIYFENVVSQVKEIIDSSLFASAIVKYIGQTNYFEGTIGQLLATLVETARGMETSADLKRKEIWPQDGRTAGRLLNTLKTPLLESGIKVVRNRNEKNRTLLIKRIDIQGEIPLIGKAANDALWEVGMESLINDL